jgi:dTMP kinase
MMKTEDKYVEAGIPALLWLYPEIARLAPPGAAGTLAQRLGALARDLEPGASILAVDGGDVEREILFLDRGGAMRAVELLDSAPHARWILPLPGGAAAPEAVARALTAVREHPALFRAGGLVPYFVASAPGETREPVETRLLPAWSAILPGDAYPPAVRGALRELVRTLHPLRYPNFLALENYALLGADMPGDAQARRWTAPAVRRKPSKKRALIIAVEGTDGSGKSTHVEALRQWIESRGLSVRVEKIYRHGVFHDTVTRLTTLCAGDKNMHLWRLERIAKLFDSVKLFYSDIEGELSSTDVLIFDRYVQTHYAAAIGRYHYDPYGRELMSVFPAADRLFLLDAPVSQALDRIAERDELTVDENPYMIERYRHAFAGLADREGMLVLDATRAFEENRDRIRSEVGRLLPKRAEEKPAAVHHGAAPTGEPLATPPASESAGGGASAEASIEPAATGEPVDAAPSTLDERSAAPTTVAQDHAADGSAAQERPE